MDSKRPTKKDKKESRFYSIPRKIEGQVFDADTLITLNKLYNTEFIDDIKGPISLGKEAKVFKGFYQKDPRAIKIYRYETTSFKNMVPYIQGDPRFHLKKDIRSLIPVWATKEFRNLKRAHKAKLSVPKPYAVLKNIIIMEFIGATHPETGEKIPAPLLKNIELDDPQLVFNKLVDFLKGLYKEDLVHADFSEFNILMKDLKEPIVIDMAQSVVLEHPQALRFLERDVEQIVRYFEKYDLNADPAEILNQLTEG